MAKKKNLSKEDQEDVSIFEEFSQNKYSSKQQKIRIQDIPIKIKCLNEKQKELRRAIEEKDVVITTGSAGTGKTFLSLLTALHLLKTEPKYNRLILIKSLQTINGESVGYLPGTLWEKLEPYMYSFTGNLDKIFGNSSITKSLIEQGVIEIFPIAYTRGVSMDECICIIDEAQNIDMHTFKTIITRIGKNSKMIFMGDTEQIDRKNKEESCLSRIATLFKDQEFANSIIFTDEDSVRNPIIPKLLEILKKES